MSSSTFPTKLADDYVLPAYVRGDSQPLPASKRSAAPSGDALRFIAFRSGSRVLAVTALPRRK